MCLKAFSPRYITFKNGFLKPFSSKYLNWLETWQYMD